MLSRNIDTTTRKIALIVFFCVIIAINLTGYFLQQNVINKLGTIDPTNIIQIRVANRIYTDSNTIGLIVNELHHVDRYHFSQGGCYAPTELEIMFHSGEPIRLAIARDPHKNILIIQEINDELPECIIGQPLKSDNLLHVFANIGINL